MPFPGHDQEVLFEAHFGFGEALNKLDLGVPKL